jgi:hypothetical protein
LGTDTGNRNQHGQLQLPFTNYRLQGRPRGSPLRHTNLFIAMTVDAFYGYASVLIFIPWLLLIAAPNWRFTEPIAFGSALVLSLVAAWFTFNYLTNGEAGGSLLSLEGLRNLFRNQAMVLTGWFNYLSFCLLVGIWQVHDARQEKIPHLGVVPGLVLTMLAGPAGLLVYLLVRAVRKGKWEVG